MAVIQRALWGGGGGTAWRYEHVPTSLTFVTTSSNLTGNVPFLSGVKIAAEGQADGSFGLPVPAANPVTADLSGTTMLTSIGGTVIRQQSLQTDLFVGVSGETTAGSFAAGTAVSGGTSVSYTLQPGETLAGFAGRAGTWLDAFSVLVESAEVVAKVSLDTSNTTCAVSTDVVGATEMWTDDKLKWIPDPSSKESFTFDKIEFYNTQAMDDPVGRWSVAEGIWTGTGFTYSFPQTPTATLIEIEDTENPTDPDPHWYLIWVRDANDNVHVLDPEIINYSRRD